jgi:hypothetical protein
MSGKEPLIRRVSRFLIHYWGLLLISLTIAQGFVAHASQTMYKTLTENNNYAEFMLSDYLRYCP